MTEEIRYLKISVCTSCPHVGHSIDVHNKKVVFCCNPINQDMIAPREILDKNTIYPIICSNSDKGSILIPKWCKLPSNCGGGNRECMTEASFMSPL